MSDNPIQCDVQYNPVDIFLTLSILFGIILSYLPQHLRIVKLNSSEGISPWYLLLGGLASISNLTNVSILQAPYVACCPSVSPIQCFANLLGLIQMSVQWLMFHIIFILYFKMYPENLKFTQNDTLSRNWALSLKIKRIVKVYSFFLLLLMLSWAIFLGFPQPIATAFAWILGVFSMLLSLLQFLPQIYQTIIHKQIGALSIPTMLMQTPGSFIFCYTLALSPGVNASTWLTYLVSGSLQGLLLVICIYYHYFNKTSEYTVIIDEHESNVIIN